MSYSKACEILNFITPKSTKENAELAKSKLSTMNSKTPLRYKVACQILIDNK